jgi:hypothetical protein
MANKDGRLSEARVRASQPKISVKYKSNVGWESHYISPTKMPANRSLVSGSKDKHSVLSSKGSLVESRISGDKFPRFSWHFVSKSGPGKDAINNTRKLSTDARAKFSGLTANRKVTSPPFFKYRPEHNPTQNPMVDVRRTSNFMGSIQRGPKTEKYNNNLDIIFSSTTNVASSKPTFKKVALSKRK